MAITNALSSESILEMHIKISILQKIYESSNCITRKICILLQLAIIIFRNRLGDPPLATRRGHPMHNIPHGNQLTSYLYIEEKKIG